MYAQAAIKPNTLLRNGAYGIVMRGVQKCTRGCSSLRGRKRLPLCCIKLDTATDSACGAGLLCFVPVGGALSHGVQQEHHGLSDSARREVGGQGADHFSGHPGRRF